MRVRAGVLVVFVAAAVVGCGSGEDELPTGPLSKADYGAALQQACGPVEAAAKRAEEEVPSVPDDTLIEDPAAYARKVHGAIRTFMDAVDDRYPAIAALQPPSEYAAFARQLRADRDAVRAYTAGIRKAMDAPVSSSEPPVREPDPPQALRQTPPADLARAAPACRRLFPISG